MKTCFYLFVCFILVISCQNESSKKSLKINDRMLLSNLKILSHDSLEGRRFGSKGNILAQEFIAHKFDSIGLTPAFPNGSIQKFPYTFKGKSRQRLYPTLNPNEDFSNVKDTTVIGGNVVTMINGEIKKAIVITAHLDHLGIIDGKIYNGTDDNASGAAALISIANYFKTKKTKHTLIFAAVDAEEIGSLGCKYLLNNFPINTENIVLNINMDMISHNDSLEIYASGLYHNPTLKTPLEKLNSKITILYGHDDPNNKDEEDWTYSSDHREFHKRKIPYIYFGVVDHKDYHKSTDTFENINPEFYIEAVQLIIDAIEGYDSYLTP